MSNPRGITFYLVRASIASGITFLFVLFLALASSRGTPTHTNTVTVYAFSDMLSSDVFEQFTEKTGIQVNVKHFETVEEIVTKLLFTPNSDIDVVVPSDSMVEIFAKEHLLQPIDYAQLTHVSEIDSRLRSRFFDPDNRYSVPFSWSPVGIGYDARLITTPSQKIGWDLIFGCVTPEGLLPPATKYGDQVDKVCLGEDLWETLFLGALHLFGSFERITDEQQEAVVALLRKQKEWLECYTNNLAYFLVSGVTPAAVMPAAYVVKMKRDYPWVDFTIPAVGSLLFIGNLVIPKASKRVKLVHKVIDYLISVEGGLACFEEHAYNPANRNTYKQLPSFVRTHPYLFPDSGVFRSLNTLHNKLPLKRVERLWQKIKL